MSLSQHVKVKVIKRIYLPLIVDVAEVVESVAGPTVDREAGQVHNFLVPNKTLNGRARQQQQRGRAGELHLRSDQIRSALRPLTALMGFTGPT